MRNVLSFITLVPYRSICQKLVTISRGLYLNSEKQKRKRFLILTSAIKRAVRKFHVVVVQRRQRNVQKAWCTCKDVVLLISVLVLPLSLPSPPSLSTSFKFCKMSIQSIKGLFTWSGGPRCSGVSFFCFHALVDTKQKKLTPPHRGPPLHVNRV